MHATSGPGGIHLLNSLYYAKLDHQPVVAIVDQQKRMSLGGYYQQKIDLQTLYKDVAAEYVHCCRGPTQAAHLIHRAYRIAQTARTVTTIVRPGDIQEIKHHSYTRFGSSSARVVYERRAGEGLSPYRSLTEGHYVHAAG